MEAGRNRVFRSIGKWRLQKAGEMAALDRKSADSDGTRLRFQETSCRIIE